MTRRWFVDVWDDEDPAIVRMNEALALRPTEEPSRPDGPTVAPDTTTRRERIAQLARLVETGDRAAEAALRELLADK